MPGLRIENQNLLREMRNPIISLHILRIYIFADRTNRADEGRPCPCRCKMNIEGQLCQRVSVGKKGQEHQGFSSGEEAAVLEILETTLLSLPADPENPGAKD